MKGTNLEDRDSMKRGVSSDPCTGAHKGLVTETARPSDGPTASV
jgi:hypothetical protein